MGERKVSVQIDNTIFLKPSTELIADEYEHFDENGKTLVHVFTDNEHDGEVQNFAETMIGAGYEVPKKNVHHLMKDDFFANIKAIQDQAVDFTGLIVFVCCATKSYGKVNIIHGDQCTTMTTQEICRKFDSQHCKALKNKPKIFIFEIKVLSITVVDGMMRKHIPFEKAYDTPLEADILLIQNTSVNEASTFVKQFCDNIKTYGKHEHVITLASCIESDENPPLIVSTLTRKFYFCPSDSRGHHLHIHNHHNDVAKLIKELKNELAMTSSKTRVNTNTRTDGRVSRATARNNADAQRGRGKNPPWKY